MIGDVHFEKAVFFPSSLISVEFDRAFFILYWLIVGYIKIYLFETSKTANYKNNRIKWFYQRGDRVIW